LPNAIVGAVTGIGFIGGGIVVRRAVRTDEIISGITTAAAIFATAAIGARRPERACWRWRAGDRAGSPRAGRTHLPLLRLLDALCWSPRFRNDEELYRDEGTPILPVVTIVPGNGATGAIALVVAAATGWT